MTMYRFGKTMINTHFIEQVNQFTDHCLIRFTSGNEIKIFCIDPDNQTETDLTIYRGTPTELMEFLRKLINIIPDEIINKRIE